MSVSLSSFSHALPQPQSQLQNWYAKATHLAKQYIKPGTLDWTEVMVFPAILAAGQVFSTSLTRLPTFKELIGAGVLLGAMFSYIKYLKFPFIKKEMQAVIESSKENDRTMLIFRSSLNDRYGVFTNHSSLDEYQKLGRNYSIDILETPSREARHKAQESLTAQNKKYDRIEFRVHGSQNCLELGPGDVVDRGAMSFFDWLNNRIKPGGLIVSQGCESAKGEGNIAERISYWCPKATIIASSATIHGIFGSKYDSNGIPSFNDGIFLGKDTTRTYREGNLVQD